ncbi:hypothetical protein [Dyadobacter sp. NIV53]|uniref:hypothetical protein n=1 Tax=Dyadobacter sp. NIV53 TaxID=2861765 RepID=UPI001C87664C|nr:hypothetical protein [Dyadobacter sp. NIV53]
MKLAIVSSHLRHNGLWIKKAPFSGDKSNSMADAPILFSAIEFIKQNSEVEFLDDVFNLYPKTIFVSANKTDFCKSKSDQKLHSDLSPLFEEIKMQFFISLPLALNSVEKLFKDDEISQIDQDMADFYENYSYYCEECDPDDEHSSLNYINFGSSEDIYPVNEKDLNQLEIDLGEEFANSKNFGITKPIHRGFCGWCDTEHIRCECGEVMAIYSHQETLECFGCGLIYTVEKVHVGSGIVKTEIHFIPEDKVNEDDD